MKRSLDDVCKSSKLKQPMVFFIGESSTQPNMAGGGGDQRLTRVDAFAYLKKVKDELEKRGKYEDFLEFMMDFQAQRVDATSVLRRLKKLFKPNKELILGFNSFLPKGYGIKLPFKEKVRDFIGLLMNRFEGNETAFISFLYKLFTCKEKIKSDTKVYQEVAALFKDHADLLEGFTQFFPNPSGAASTHYASAHNSYLHDNNSPTRTVRLLHVEKKEREHSSHKSKTVCRVEDSGAEPLHDTNEKFVLHPFSYSCKESSLKKIFRREEHGPKRMKVDNGDRDCDRNDRMKESDRKSLDRDKFNATTNKDVSVPKMSLYASKDKYAARPTSGPDNSNCEQGTPSYRLLPKNYPIPSTSHRTELDAEVLNDHCVLVNSDSKDFKRILKNQYEETLFRCEDDRFELDMLLESFNTTTRRVEELLEKINANIAKGYNPICIEEHLTVLNLRCIERMYGDYGLDVIDELKKNASLVLPVILTRLTQKHDELSRCRADFSKVWGEVYAKNFHKSLDQRNVYFK